MNKILFIILLAITGCKTNTELPKTLSVNKTIGFKPIYATGPHVIVYKTESDYYNLVPIQLSNNKLSIVSYPSQIDLLKNGVYRLPTKLHNGYLLDNKGIGANTAFLKYTYQEYVNFDSIPQLDSLYNNIIEKKPFIEIYDCGLEIAFKDKINQLNSIIDENKLEEIFVSLK